MDMYAYVTRQGTAMAETALCQHHRGSAALQKSTAQAMLSADWNPAEPLHNCGDNPELECICCGSTADGCNDDACREQWCAEHHGG